MADDSNEDEVVLYRVRHGSSSYIVLPAEAGAVPGHEMLERTRSQVDEEHAGFLRDRVAEDDDIRDLFHSGRAVKHRLPSFMKTGEELPIRSEGLSTAQAQALLGKFGRNEIGEPTKPDWKLFVEQFTAPMPIGLWIAIVIELALQNWIDACILFALQMTNGIVAFTEAKKAGDAIAALKGSLKPTAQAKRDGRFQEVDAGELVPGDLILLRQGAAVPADCIVQSRSLHVDQSVITGESHPVAIPEGEQARMGSTVTRGEAEATVFKTGKNTFYGKTATLLQATGNELGELRKMLFFVVLVLLAFSGVLCVICLAFLLGNHMNLQSSIEFVVVLMVASIPVAMEVVVTATLALGSRQLSSHSAIVPNLSAIERLSGMDILCSDKTGTLTLNKMVIQHECPAFVPNVNRDDVLLYATLAVKWNLPPKDAIDTMILSAADLDRCNAFEQIDYVPFDASIKRTEATIRDQHGHVFQVAKGAPHTLLDMCPDKGRIQNAVESSVYDLAARGVRSLAVAKTDVNGDWHMQGLLAFLDPPRPDSRDTIKLANQYGVAVKMITGDHQLIAVETAKAMELGHANILPCKEGVLPTIDLSGEKVQVPKTLGRDYAAMILYAHVARFAAA